LLYIAAARVLSAIAWFNPLAHVIVRALVSAREDGSDDWAIAHTSRDPFAYAHALLRSARMTATSLDGGWLRDPLASGAHPMGKRLTRLLSGEARTDRALGPIAITLLLIVGAASMPGAHMPDPSSGDDNHRVVIRRVITEDAVTRTRR
jgi:beta-lactamase regulating signal transducer with metallopeptidase domain